MYLFGVRIIYLYYMPRAKTKLVGKFGYFPPHQVTHRHHFPQSDPPIPLS